MSDNGTFKLSKPATLLLEGENGVAAVVDVFAARRFLGECETEANQEARWRKIRQYLAKLFSTPENQVTEDQVFESQAFEFHEVIVALGNKSLEKIREQRSSIASLPQPTLESQPIT